MTKPSKGFMSSRRRRLEIERIAVAAALEDLAVFYQAIRAAAIGARNAARYVGGHTEARLDRLMANVDDALTRLPEVSLDDAGVMKRAGHRLVEPLLELRPRPEPPAGAMVRSAEDLALPLREANRMRDAGMSWRQIREAMLQQVAS